MAIQIALHRKELQ